MMTEGNPSEAASSADVAAWKQIVAEYQKPSTPRAIWQIVNTLGPYAFLWYLMYLSRPVSWTLTLLLAALAGMLLVRVFIIFHDCGHGSFLKSRRANDIVGLFAGILTFTPYYHWRWEHALHHASAGDLDKRGVGDIWTMTVQEYLESSRGKRFAYRLARNPVILFVIAPLWLFLIQQRFTNSNANTREKLSVYLMNACLLAMAAAFASVYGIVPYIIIQLVVMAVAAGAGVWMFYVQHQFEGVYWERNEEWDYTAAALQGSSYYQLPKTLQWLSGNIGFHHIHHLSPRIPNYNLERCHCSHPMFRDVKPITLRTSMKSLSLRLWDENLKQLVGYRRVRELRKAQKEAVKNQS